MSKDDKKVMTDHDGDIKNDWRLFCILNKSKIKLNILLLISISLMMVGITIIALTLIQENQTSVKFIIPQFEKSSKLLRTRRDNNKNSINKEEEMNNYLNEKYSEIRTSDTKVLKRGVENSIQKLAMDDFMKYSDDEEWLQLESDLLDIDEHFKEVEYDVDELLKRKYWRSKRDVSTVQLDPITKDSFMTHLEEIRREKRLAEQSYTDVRDEYMRCKKSTDSESTKCEQIYQNMKASFKEITEKLREMDLIIKEIEQREQSKVEATLASNEENDDQERKKSKDKKNKKKDSHSSESFESHEKTKKPKKSKQTSTTSSVTHETTFTTTKFDEIETTTHSFFDEETTTDHEARVADENPIESCPASLASEVRRHPMIDEEIEDFNVKLGHDEKIHNVHSFVNQKLTKNIGNNDENLESVLGRIIDIYGRNFNQGKSLSQKTKPDPMVSGPFLALCDQMQKQQKQAQPLNTLPTFSNFPTTGEASKGTSKVVMNSGFPGGYPICFVNYPQPQNLVYPVAPIYVQPQIAYPTAYAGFRPPQATISTYPTTTYRDATTFCTFDASNSGSLPVQFDSTTETPPSIDERRDENHLPTPFDVIFATFPNQMIANFNQSQQSHNCQEGKIPCFTTSQCIAKSSWCDSNVDCLDASDETACSCKSRLHESRICDGYFDCPMGDDELGCFECDRFQFSCYSSDDEFQNNKAGGMSCYSVIEKCDGFMNCKNGRDEEDCSILVKSIGPIVNPFLIGQSEGVLHRNHKGRWFMVCDGPESWINEACSAEVGQKSTPRVEIRSLNIGGPFISEIDMTKTISDTCKINSEKNNVIIVRCERPKCGTSRVLEMEQETPHRRESPGEVEVGSARIVGGIDALPMEFPFMVAIFKDGNFHCGGSIFNEMWIITAAHCLKDSKSHFYEIRAGMLRRSSFSPQSQITHATHAIPHENYDPHTMGNDIALIRVKTPFSFNRWVRPICIPKAGKNPFIIPPPKTICTTLGWGAIKERGPDPDALKVVDVPILEKCKYENDRMSQMICAGETFGTRDACQGDSGGPLVCKSTTNSWILTGVVSHGQGCARANEPGVYTRVSMYIDWIKNKIENLESIKDNVVKENCPGFTCVWGIQKCLPKHKLCDGFVDCLGGEDEASCSNDWLSLLDNLNLMSPLNVTEVHHASIDPKIHEESNKDEKKIVKKDVARKIFECYKISQFINENQRCDKIVDCEDGTDEHNCTCADNLRHKFPQLICDGNVDCFDSSDEKNCLNCTETQFTCTHSRICIEKDQRCDGHNDCKLKEDEINCLTLTDGHFVDSDVNGKPVLHRKGVVTQNIQSSWRIYCDEKFGANTKEFADHLCHNIGFHGSKSSRPTEIKFFKKFSDFTLKDKTKNNHLFREEISNPVDGCIALEIECLPFQSNISVNHLIHHENFKKQNHKNSPSLGVSWPWSATIFIDGKLKHVGILLSNEWILVNKNSMKYSKHLLDGHQVVAVLGNSYAQFGIKSFHEQIHQIDCIKQLNDTNSMLLHLNQSASFNRYVLPSLIHNTTEDHQCIAITLDNTHHLKKILLKEKTCDEKNCYQINEAMKQTFNCETSSLMTPAMIMCKNKLTSWYPKGVTKKNICDYKHGITIDLINSTEIQSITDNKCIDCKHQKSIINCDTHKCPLGNCLRKDEICNGKNDCHDGSDEIKCTKIEICTLDKFVCRNGHCVEKSKFCDHKDDCGDKSDEPSECTCFSFLKSTSPKKICDGIRHCWDRSDEDTHYCGKTIPEELSFKCGDSEFVIPMEMVCDQRLDCPNGADEMNCKKILKSTDGFGEVMRRSFGVWYSECFPKSTKIDTESIANELCNTSKISARITNHNVNDTHHHLQDDIVASSSDHIQKSPAKKVISETKFSAVKINDRFTVHLRSDRPLTKIVEWDEDDHANCHRLEVKCG